MSLAFSHRLLVVFTTAFTFTILGCGGSDAEVHADADDTGGAAVANGEAGAWDIEQELKITYDGPPEPGTVAEARETVRALREKYSDSSRVPEVMSGPFDTESVLNYAKGVKSYIVSAPIDAAWLRGELVSGGVHVLTFTSPSTVRHLCELLDDEARAALRHCTIAAVGPTTAEALRRHGLEPDVVPERPGMEELVAALARHLRARREGEIR